MSHKIDGSDPDISFMSIESSISNLEQQSQSFAMADPEASFLSVDTNVATTMKHTNTSTDTASMTSQVFGEPLVTLQEFNGNNLLNLIAAAQPAHNPMPPPMATPMDLLSSTASLLQPSQQSTSKTSISSMKQPPRTEEQEKHPCPEELPFKVGEFLNVAPLDFLQHVQMVGNKYGFMIGHSLEKYTSDLQAKYGTVYRRCRIYCSSAKDGQRMKTKCPFFIHFAYDCKTGCYVFKEVTLMHSGHTLNTCTHNDRAFVKFLRQLNAEECSNPLLPYAILAK